jgi:hypothetical protein
VAIENPPRRRARLPDRESWCSRVCTKRDGGDVRGGSREGCGRGEPIASWRRSYRTTESRHRGCVEGWSSDITVYSWCTRTSTSAGREVEVRVKSADAAALAGRDEWIERALEEAVG